MDLGGWNDALRRELVDPGEPGRGLYFYVDPDVLAAAAGMSDRDEAVVDFRAAFVQVMSPTRPFGRSVNAARDWRSRGARTLPPFLPALAMSVLAVTAEQLGPRQGV